MTTTCRRGLVAALLLAPAAAFAAPAQAAERFSVSLAGVWKTEAHVTDTTCYRLASPDSTDPIPFTGNFTAIETGELSTVRRGTARAHREDGKLEVDSYGRPARLRLALNRTSDIYGTCKPGENEPVRCGARDLRYGIGVFNEGAGMTFGFVKSSTDPLGNTSTNSFAPGDPYGHCMLAEMQEWLGRVGADNIGENPSYGMARFNRSALMDRRRKTFVLRGSAEGHPRKDTRDSEGQGETVTVDYRLDWTLTLRRVSRRSRG